VLGEPLQTQMISCTHIRLVKDYDIAFVSTGDVLRKEIMAKSEVGKRAEEIVASGGVLYQFLIRWTLTYRPCTRRIDARGRQG
jgi:adenylate kinase family enzyme